MVSSILTSSQSAQLFAIQQTERQVDATQVRLASGLRVNSALDNPQNFFEAKSLTQDASNLSRLLDGIGQGIRSIQTAENGLNGLQSIIDRAGDVLNEAKADLLENRQDVGEVILADDPVLYYRLNDESGTAAVNLGTGGTALNGIYQGATPNTGPLHFGENNGSASFNGVNNRVTIRNDVLINTSAAGYPERSVELTFEADDLGGRQVLFEEGGTGNAAGIYLDDDQIYFTARDAGDFGPFNIHTTIEEGEVYHAAFVLDSDSGTFTGYLNGEVVGQGGVNRPLSRHNGAVAIGRNAGGTFFHDGANGGNGEYFSGKVSDFALYNSVLTQEDLQARFDATQLEDTRNYEEQVSKFLDQINPFVEDASYRGVNLLQGDDLTTYFDNDGGSKLLTEGADLSVSGLGVSKVDFQTFDSFNSFTNSFDKGLGKIETFASSLSVDLNVINIREDYTKTTINTLEAGRDDLVVADQNEEGANLLALQTQQSIQIQTLSLSSQGSNIAELLSNNPISNATS